MENALAWPVKQNLKMDHANEVGEYSFTGSPKEPSTYIFADGDNLDLPLEKISVDCIESF